MRLILDRAHGRLSDDRGNGFEPATRQWQPDTASAEGEPVTPIGALHWLQHASGRPLRTPVAVIGTRTPTQAQEQAAEQTGLLLARHGLTVLCGGRAGVMEAVCRGVAEGGGLSIGLLPDTEPEAANPYVTVPLATGIGVARNALIARAAHSLIAIGGGYGTLSEIAFALQFGRPVFLLEGAPAVDGAARCANPGEALEQVARAVLRLPESAAG
ncbi:MAG: TIGR00725 family protein [Bosea sp.]|uniref:TIGR00725 family protein n=1 Tax=Bosea sp. (in: a-proteobacteria) TaxID=1871050 RepID=UPI001AC18C88|nr:TIGR00725 family protein [Bosea sp. (in: a-proteobacteria)]MBN9471139.1 TIGR00725 family protein [Bosea sp. (in: a-proteobacteria)]